MKTFHLETTIIAILLLQKCHTKILRNNALINKMVSHFQKDNTHNMALDKNRARERQRNDIDMSQLGELQAINEESDRRTEDTQRQNPRRSERPTNSDYQTATQQESRPMKRERILNLMQSVLCKNFPAIPCNIIIQDEALTQLIERSIQQIVHKQYQNSGSTVSPRGSTPVINSEDLSNFLEVSNTGYFISKKKREEKKRRKPVVKMQNHWSHEKMRNQDKTKGKHDMKRADSYNNGRKKMRKFYPHKIKYKDKNTGKNEYREYSEEKFSMSVEVPDMKLPEKVQQKEMKSNMAYKVEAEDQPVWRIDYMKHGTPSMNMFGYEDDRLSGKLIKPGPNVILDENGLEQSSVIRKEVLHPDVYIKKNFGRKGNIKFNSEGID